MTVGGESVRRLCGRRDAKQSRLTAGWRHFLTFNVALVGFAVAVFAYLYALRIAGLPLFCYTSRLLHLYCPGCGMSRATEALLAGDLAGSLIAHPFVLLFAAFAMYYEVTLLLHARGGCRPSPRPAVVYAFGLLGFAILRNLLLILFHVDPLGDLIGFWS